MNNFVIIETSGGNKYLKQISPLEHTQVQVDYIQKKYFPKEEVLDWQHFEAANLDLPFLQ